MKPESHLSVSFILQNELLTFSRSFLKLWEITRDGQVF